MIYLVTADNQQVWQGVYLDTYVRELRARNIPFALLPSQDTKDYRFNEGDLVWIMHYKDIVPVAKHARSYGAKTMFRLSGTSLHPWCYQVDPQQEAEDFKHIDYMLTPSPDVTALVQHSDMPYNNLVETGYPMFVDKTGLDILPPRYRENKVVIAGRLSPDKQPMLAMNLLYPLIQSNIIKEVIFCYPSLSGDRWLKEYGGRERWEKLGFKFIMMNHQEWLRTATYSRYYFSASLGDTLCYSAFEAISLGCIPILPNTNYGTGLPVMRDLLMFNENSSLLYDAFSASSVKSVFQQAAAIYGTSTKVFDCLNPTYCSPEYFFDRLAHCLPIHFKGNQ